MQCIARSQLQRPLVTFISYRWLRKRPELDPGFRVCIIVDLAYWHTGTMLLKACVE